MSGDWTKSRIAIALMHVSCRETIVAVNSGRSSVHSVSRGCPYHGDGDARLSEVVTPNCVALPRRVRKTQRHTSCLQRIA